MAVKTVKHNGIHFSISYLIINPEANSDIVFLHGWGSNKGLMKQSFSPFLPQYRHIYIDMPGFGASPCDVALHTTDYAVIIQDALSQINAKLSIVLGHSFGGKVATLLNPELLVLVASSGILVPKSFKVRAKIATFKILKYTGFSSMRKLFVSKDANNMSEGMYQTFKNVVNEDFSTQFQSFKNQALLCYGQKDTATPLWTGEKINSIMTNSHLVAFDGDHYFLLKDGGKISKEILKITQK